MEEARRDAGLSSVSDLIAQVNEAISKRDFERFSTFLHPDVVWEQNLGGGSPEEGVYRGREEVVRLLERIVEPWESLRTEPQRIDELGDGVYLVTGDLRTKHSESATEFVTPYEQRLEIKSGLVERGGMKTGSQ
jgi:ketosteroid isomerase-like protein